MSGVMDQMMGQENRDQYDTKGELAKLRREVAAMKDREMVPSYTQTTGPPDEPLPQSDSLDLLAEVSNILTEMRHRLGPAIRDDTALAESVAVDVYDDEKMPPAGPLVSGLRELVSQARRLLREISI